MMEAENKIASTLRSGADRCMSNECFPCERSTNGKQENANNVVMVACGKRETCQISLDSGCTPYLTTPKDEAEQIFGQLPGDNKNSYLNVTRISNHSFTLNNPTSDKARTLYFSSLL